MNADEVKNEIEEILSRNGFLKTDAEDFFNAMSDMLSFMADEIEKAEPYATTTIISYRSIASELTDYNEVINGLVNEEEEDNL